MLPLKDLQVLDLSMLLPGPLCTVFLADFGAEVIKVEAPKTGDYIRWVPPMIGKMSARHHLVNRNKKSITLDLKKEKGKEVFFKLVRESDILIEGFRPGVMGRLGMDYSTARELNPRIIYCSLSGYGQNGPYKNLVGHDINYIGIGGLLDITGQKGEPPTVPGTPIGDIGGGMMALTGILTALYARNQTGKGQYVDISMLDGLIAWLYHIAGDYFATNYCPSRGDSLVTGGYACYSVYPTKDGKYVTVGALEDKFWKTFCKTMNLEALIPDQLNPEKQIGMKDAFTKVFLTKTQAEWVKTFENIEICFGPVKSLSEAFDDPQLLEREMVFEMADPEVGKIKQLGIPIKLSDTPGEVRRSAPALGEHTEEIISKLGYTDSEIESMRKDQVI